MTPFELVEPRSLREAVGLLDADDPSVRPLGGGTALMLLMKAGAFRPSRLVSLRAVEKRCSTIEAAANGELRIGALTTLSVLEHSPLVRTRTPVVAQALRTLSNVRVRNVATIAGHLAHADPHMDLPPVMIALGAMVTIIGPQGERMIPVEELFTGYYETVLRLNELIAEVIVPPQGQKRASYLKCTTRSADDWPAVGVAVSLDTDGLLVRKADIVLGAATEKPTRLRMTESILHDSQIDDAVLRRAGEAAADEVVVMADAQGSGPYKKQLVRVYVERAIRAALDASVEAMP